MGLEKADEKAELAKLPDFGLYRIFGFGQARQGKGPALDDPLKLKIGSDSSDVLRLPR